MLYCHMLGGIVRCVSRLDECIKDFAKVPMPSDSYAVCVVMFVLSIFLGCCCPRQCSSRPQGGGCL